MQGRLPHPAGEGGAPLIGIHEPVAATGSRQQPVCLQIAEPVGAQAEPVPVAAMDFHQSPAGQTGQILLVGVVAHRFEVGDVQGPAGPFAERKQLPELRNHWQITLHPADPLGQHGWPEERNQPNLTGVGKAGAPVHLELLDVVVDMDGPAIVLVGQAGIAPQDHQQLRI